MNARVRGFRLGAAAVAAAVAVPAHGMVVQDAKDAAASVNATLGLARSTVVSVTPQPLAGDGILAIVPVDGLPHVMVLERHSVRAEGYRLLVQGPDGALEEVPAGPVTTYRGTLAGAEDATVAASLLEDGLYARITFGNGDEFWLEPIGARVPAMANQYVVYGEGDVLPSGATCGLGLLDDPFADFLGDGDPGTAMGTGNCVAELACDADFEYFTRWGSVAGVESRINSVINTMNLQYQQDVGITHMITAIVVRATSNDPYTKKPADQLLNQFRNEWENNQTAVQRDVAHLFTGRDLAGTTIGIAWISAVCTNFGYGLVQSDFNSNFACVTDLSAHELGHNWGADHCSCSGWTMNSGITCANRFNPTATIPEILAFRDSRTCLDGCGGGQPQCGNGICEAGETECNCPADCGSPPASETSCTDGVDNDCDGLVDCADPDCGSDPSCATGNDDAVVACITYTTRGGPNSDKHLDTTATIVDVGGNPVANASVSLTLSAGASSYGFGGTTDGNGEVTFTLINAGNTCYTSDVTNVSAPGFTFNGAEPANGFQKGSDSWPDADCNACGDPCGSNACGS